MWAKMMGADTPGEFSGALPIPLAQPQTAHRLQAYYDTRSMLFGDEVYDLQSNYFMLTQEARREYLQDHPLLEQYWNWRRDFMYRNPDLAPYIEDDPEKLPQYGTAEELEAIMEGQPNINPIEWHALLGPQMMNLIQDYSMGEALPEVALRRLEELGVSPEEVLGGIQ
jgi:hypothetical protein